LNDLLYGLAALFVLRRAQIRLRLSRAKHPSIRGHSKLSRRIARMIPYYEYDSERFYCSDNAPKKIINKRRGGFTQLADFFNTQAPASNAMTDQLQTELADVAFTNAYRVPYPYRHYVNQHIKIHNIVIASSGTKIQDLDGHWSYDLSGSYGVNVFGYDFYKDCMQKGLQATQDLGPVLGLYHPLIADNSKRLREISGLDEISFHMSGTEAVMQAVRLARYHTGKSHLVRFCGAYHGWWDGVQPGIGNGRKTNDVYTLKDMDRDTLKVLCTRKDIACVLINPLQGLHPNANAPGDAMLINSDRSAAFDRQAYTKWLHEVRRVCTERGIILIMDEVFVGFRIAYRGAQEYFNIKADMVTYGKTLGGGLPVGVVCGRHELMKRYKDNRPSDICFARGTFNSHPYVMATMNEFLKRLDNTAIQQSYQQLDHLWDNRVQELNNELNKLGLPVKIANLSSIWTIFYTLPSRYNWMFQFYLRAEGLNLSWIGTGRLIMSHNYTDEDYKNVKQKIINAASSMLADGWWWQDAELNNKSIKKQMLRETLAKILRK